MSQRNALLFALAARSKPAPEPAPNHVPPHMAQPRAASTATALTASGDPGDMSKRRPGADLARQLAQVREPAPAQRRAAKRDLSEFVGMLASDVDAELGPMIAHPVSDLSCFVFAKAREYKLCFDGVGDWVATLDAELAVKQVVKLTRR